MEWPHLTALTLLQPHKKLQLFLVCLISSDPLRLGLSWPLGASAHGRLPQHKRGDPLEESPICPSQRLKTGAAQLQWIHYTCSGLCNPNTRMVQVYFPALWILYIGWFAFNYVAIFSHSWLGRWLSWSIWLSCLFNPIFQKILLCVR